MKNNQFLLTREETIPESEEKTGGPITKKNLRERERKKQVSVEAQKVKTLLQRKNTGNDIREIHGKGTPISKGRVEEIHHMNSTKKHLLS